MKKILLIATAMLVSVGVFAQGTADFSNIGAPPITNPAGDPAGPEYSAALYYAPDGVTDEGMFMQLGAAASLLGNGVVFAGTRTTPSTTPGGGVCNFQVRAWLTAEGTYEENLTKPGVGQVGRSAILNMPTGNPSAVPATLPTSLVADGGLQGFQITIVPEPSVVALGLLGAGALLLLRRRK